MTENRKKTEHRTRSNRLTSAVFGFLDSVREAKRMQDDFYRNNPHQIR